MGSRVRMVALVAALVFGAATAACSDYGGEEGSENGGTGYGGQQEEHTEDGDQEGGS